MWRPVRLEAREVGEEAHAGEVGEGARAAAYGGGRRSGSLTASVGEEAPRT